MNENLLLWGWGLIAAGVLLVFLEVFVPSGGLLSILSVGSAIAGVIVLFRASTTWGLTGLLTVMILGPCAVAFALRVWPSTPIGRRMLGEKPADVVEAERRAAQREADERLALLGAEGVVLTDLRPVGVVQVGDRRVDALSETGLVRAGARVRVTVVESHQVKVRPV